MAAGHGGGSKIPAGESDGIQAQVKDCLWEESTSFPEKRGKGKVGTAIQGILEVADGNRGLQVSQVK